MSFMKCTIWVVIVALSVSQVEELFQQTLVDFGIMKKPVAMKDFCDVSYVPRWTKGIMGCPHHDPTDHKVKIGRRIKLSDDIKSSLGFKKTLMDRIYDVIGDGLYYLQIWILPKDFKMPCLFGDCDMHKEVKKDHKAVLMYNQKTFKLNPTKSDLENDVESSNNIESNVESGKNNEKPLEPTL